MAWWKTKPPKRLVAGACSDAGQVRTENQDAYGIFEGDGDDGERIHLFLVADGMGGHTRGGEASRTAVAAVRETFFSAAESLSVEERLVQAVAAANAQIFALAHRDDGVDRMGTTVTVLVIAAGRLYLAHVGDSRAYRIGRNGVEQLTQDHTWTLEMQRQGILSEAEARAHPRRHTLTRALGPEPSVTVDVASLGAAHPGDAFLLCSDGLAQVAPEDIRRLVLAHPPQQACEVLVRLANERGGNDNITVVLVRID
jgi:serine/threonine protein phosphatase PrpC